MVSCLLGCSPPASSTAWGRLSPRTAPGSILAPRPSRRFNGPPMDPDILFSQDSGLGQALLNRPKALNALTLEMCHALEAQLRAWAEDPAIAAVVIKGAGGRAFCAGGDIRRLSEAAEAGDDYAYRFWHDEYRLNALISHYAKPYLAVIDG